MCQNDFQPTKNFKDFHILRCKQFTVMELCGKNSKKTWDVPLILQCCDKNRMTVINIDKGEGIFSVFLAFSYDLTMIHDCSLQLSFTLILIMAAFEKS